MELASAARLTSAIAGIGIAVNACEFIAARRELNEFFDWSILRTKYIWLFRHGKLRLFDWLFEPWVFVLLLVVEVCAAIATPIVFERRLITLTCCMIVLTIHLLKHFRFIYGFDGSDQMQTVIWGSLVLYNLSNSVIGRNAAVLFIAGQLILSYLTSGIAKAISPIWRNGSAVGLVIRTESYGSTSASALVSRFHLSPLLSWSTIMLEVCGPLVILFGPTPTLVFLGCAVAFHVGIASIMGLNTFVWAFAATFPAVFYLSQWCHVLHV